VGLKIIYSRFALRDLKEAYDFISKDSVRYAKQEKRLIKEAIKKLKINPLLGKTFEKFNEENTRELIFKNYRIVYDIYENEFIEILTIHHHARLITNNPAFKDEE
jgi:toxin ParE1/3/4